MTDETLKRIELLKSYAYHLREAAKAAKHLAEHALMDHISPDDELSEFMLQLAERAESLVARLVAEKLPSYPPIHHPSVPE